MAGTYYQTVVLSDPATQNPFTLTKTGLVHVKGGGDGVFGTAGFAWTLSSQGTIASTGGNGVRLTAGGRVTNGQSGSSGGLISGAIDGVRIEGTSSGRQTTAVLNYGSIIGGFRGVYLAAAGSVINGATGSTSARISGGSFGVNLAASGTVRNFGTIEGTSDGVYVNAGAVVVNSGTIAGTGTGANGLLLGGNGTVVNNLTGLISGNLRGMHQSGGAVFNYGTIQATETGSIGVFLSAGGTVVNGATGSASARIAGGLYGVYATSGTVRNFGTIEGTGTGIYLSANATVVNNATGLIRAIYQGIDQGGGTVFNYGTISATGTLGWGVYLNTGGTVINGATDSTSARISGGGFGVRFDELSGTVINFGTIEGTAGSGIRIHASGTVVNNTTGLISGTFRGMTQGGGTVFNYGTIQGTGTASTGVFLNAGATVINGSTDSTSARISGIISGVFEAVGTVINFGTIEGTGIGGLGIWLSTGGTVVNGATGSALARISGGLYGVRIDSATGTVTNFGNIVATATNGVGVKLSLGSVTNFGTVTAGMNGIGIDVTSGHITNYGAIVAPLATAVIVRYGVFVNRGLVEGRVSGIELSTGMDTTGSGQVTVSGTVIGATGISVASSVTASHTVTVDGTVIGTLGTAVSLTKGGSDRLILAPGALFQGAVDGGRGQSVVEVAATPGGLGAAGTDDGSATTVYVNLGSITNFSALWVDPNAAMDAGGALVFDTLVNQGRINLFAGDSLAVGTVADAAGAGTIDLKSGGSIHFTGPVTANQTVLFRPPGGTVVIDDPKQFKAAMTEFAEGDIIDLPLGAASFEKYDNGMLHLSYRGESMELRLSTVYGAPQFSFPDDGHGGTDIIASEAVCFCRGTAILTAHGEVPVEDLAIGDRVVTLSGAVQPIRWIGIGRDLVTRANKLAQPVIVRQGALAEGVPKRDLYLTHGHALYLAGALIPVENLVNHRSIVWDERARVVEYYHIELEDHDAVFAEGALAESYYDAGNRALFHNTRAGSAAAGTAPFAAVLNGGEAVELVWQELFARAGGRIESNSTDDPDLHLVVGGRRLDAARIEAGAYTFAFDAAPGGGLHLCSRRGVPSLVGITAHDHRRLGVALARIELRQPSLATVFEHDAPLFREGGCHPPETGYAWTDGELALPEHLFAHLDGAFTLTMQIERPGMRYPVSPVIAAAA